MSFCAEVQHRTLVHSFESYLAQHRDEIESLQFSYSVPHKQRLRYKDIRALADAISAPLAPGRRTNSGAPTRF